MHDLERRALLDCWKSPAPKNQSIFQQNMSDGFCFGKVNTDCCLLLAFTAMPCKVSCSQTVEYVNT